MTTTEKMVLIQVLCMMENRINIMLSAMCIYKNIDAYLQEIIQKVSVGTSACPSTFFIIYVRAEYPPSPNSINAPLDIHDNLISYFLHRHIT